ncbi:MAG: ATP-binding protein [bacterium]
MRNINKFFPRLSITTKLLVAFLGLGAAPLVAFGFYSVFSLSRSMEEQALSQLQFQINAVERNIDKFLKEVQHDLQFLSTASSLEKLADLQTPSRPNAPDPAFVQQRQIVEDEFLRFSGGKRVYYQVRYIDASGQEIVRLNHDTSGVYVVPKTDLQDKSRRYYFRQAMQRAQDEIYLSPMDLNIERGVIEIPHRPVVRYATPVFDSQGSKTGIVIINIFAEAIFEIIGGVPEGAGSFLTDSNGLYLYQSNLTDDRTYFRKRSLFNDYPAEVAEALVHKRRGLANTTSHILAYARIHPQVNHQKSEDAWILLIAAPRRIVLATANHLKTVFIGILAMLVVAAALLGVIAARQFTGPVFGLIRSADKIAGGDFEHRISVETNDEIEDLASHFNSMALQLGDSHAKLQRWNEDLQKEVAKRTGELVLSEARLKIEKQKLDDIVSSIGAELCLINRAQEVVWVNKTLAERCGGETNALGRKCFALFHGGNGHCPDCRCEQAFAKGKGKNIVVSRPGRNGKERFFQVVSTPVVDVSGKVSHLLEMHLDITESVLRERALEKQRAEKDRLASQVQMAAGVIHEVAKPLAAMKTTLQVLEEEVADREQCSYLKGIEQEIDQLNEFLKTFSSFARPRPLELQPCKIDEIVRQVILLTRKEAERRKVQIRESYHTPDGVNGTTAMLDPLQMQHVLLNIFINAFEAMPAGGVLKIHGDLVEKPLPHLLLSVIDNGVGMDKAQKEKIFEPFYSTKPNGTGLGLAIVRQIVREHGGDIQVQSRRGNGTSVALSFPVNGRKNHSRQTKPKL